MLYALQGHWITLQIHSVFRVIILSRVHYYLIIFNSCSFDAATRTEHVTHEGQ
jgi:hypothetical protein